MSPDKPRLNSGCVTVGCLLLLLFVLPCCAEAQTLQDSCGETGSPPSFPIAGDPPLTLAMVNQAADLLERVLDTKLTAEQHKQFEDFLVASWRCERADEMQSALRAVQLADQLDRKTPLMRELYLRMLRPRFLEELRAQPTRGVSRWILYVYDSAHKPTRSS